MVEILVDFFKDYGYWGMGLLAFLSGTVVPITSEVLLVLFLSLGLNAVGITLVAALGNTLGGITCFMLGSLASKEWLQRFWDTPLRKGVRRYYDNCLYFFSFLMLAGEYKIY
jgi:membrane protein YqaA with SNARE-associated domain